MNSLNLLSARVSPPQTPAPSRSNSYGNALSLIGAIENKRSSREDVSSEKEKEEVDSVKDAPHVNAEENVVDEESPLLDAGGAVLPGSKSSGWVFVPKHIASAIINSLRWAVSTLLAPGVYLIAFLYDERGDFAPLYQFRKIGTLFGSSSRTQATAQAFEALHSDGTRAQSNLEKDEDFSNHRSAVKSIRGSLGSNSSSSGLSSDSESERERSLSETEPDKEYPISPARHTRSKSHRPDEIAPARRSIRIKLHNEDSLRQRKHRKTLSASSQSNGSGALSASDISPATLKSPTSPATSLSLTKYPRAPAPPRPLIPRRQPSYTSPEGSNGKLAQKTLILDLDETLIHSMAKGGRMSTGHMVEVKLNTYIGVPGVASIGPQHPILYYVHKRPHCDDFLRRVCKWYNLVIFTASVQEYADPVIDWLEQERKFFSGRFYRQHCTYRHGAFIKDLSSVEPDLSKVMILDNSPLSYMFHQDNAIPIEGWINDPTDNDLLHLVPLLEGLQYVTDVRALLALRGGEDGKHMTT